MWRRLLEGRKERKTCREILGNCNCIDGTSKFHVSRLPRIQQLPSLLANIASSWQAGKYGSYTRVFVRNFNFNSIFTGISRVSMINLMKVNPISPICCAKRLIVFITGGIFTQYLASLETLQLTKSRKPTENLRWNGIQIKIQKTRRHRINSRTLEQLTRYARDIASVYYCLWLSEVLCKWEFTTILPEHREEHRILVIYLWHLKVMITFYS